MITVLHNLWILCRFYLALSTSAFALNTSTFTQRSLGHICLGKNLSLSTVKLRLFFSLCSNHMICILYISYLMQFVANWVFISSSVCVSHVYLIFSPHISSRLRRSTANQKEKQHWSKKHPDNIYASLLIFI